MYKSTQKIYVNNLIVYMILSNITYSCQLNTSNDITKSEHLILTIYSRYLLLFDILHPLTLRYDYCRKML